MDCEIKKNDSISGEILLQHTYIRASRARYNDDQSTLYTPLDPTNAAASIDDRSIITFTAHDNIGRVVINKTGWTPADCSNLLINTLLAKTKITDDDDQNSSSS
jgi:hypothetical protein